MARTITPELFRQELLGDDTPAIIDTRPADSFEGWHVPGARNYPFQPDETVTLPDLESATGITTDRSVITLCAKGKSSSEFAAALTEVGFDDVAVLQDGMEGWSRLYEVAAIPTVATGLEIYQIQRVAKGCLGYLIAAPRSGEAVVVDPSRHLDEFQRVAEGDNVTITHVIDTHVHADHISGGRSLADAVDATYVLPDGASERNVEHDFTPIAANEVLTVGDVELKAIHTPGHTSEAISVLVGAEAVLTGDTVFLDSVGRTELQFGEGSAEAGANDLYDSIHRSILALPDGVQVLPGHHDVDDLAALERTGSPITTTIHDLRTGHPLLDADRTEFVERVIETLPEKPPNYERMLEINTGRSEEVPTDEAIELELGPNRCAATA